MVAVHDATPTLGAAPACRVLGLSRASLYRGRRPAGVARPRPAPPRALTVGERQGVLDLLHTRFIDQAPAQVHATLLDEGTYHLLRVAVGCDPLLPLGEVLCLKHTQPYNASDDETKSKDHAGVNECEHKVVPLSYLTGGLFESAVCIA